MKNEKSRILVLGASGLLGSRIFLNLLNKFSVSGTSFHNEMNNPSIFNLDVRDAQFSNKIAEVRPNIIINCIAYTDIEQCEINKDLAWVLNTEFPGKIAHLAKVLNAKLVHISTDHFDFGSANIRNENSKVEPVNFYGESKLAGEKKVLLVNSSAIVVRTNFFGAKPLTHVKSTFFESVIENIKLNRQSKGYINIYFSPISISELISAIVNLLDVEYSGLINICGNERISKYEFCIELARIMKCDTKLIVDGRYEPNFVKRPLDMSMSNQLYYEKTGKPIINFNKMLEAEYNLYNETKAERKTV
jgi:dTDP-4-dehydrorhamnose reductase